MSWKICYRLPACDNITWLVLWNFVPTGWTGCLHLLQGGWCRGSSVAGSPNCRESNLKHYARQPCECQLAKDNCQPSHSEYVHCPAHKLLCNSWCGHWKKVCIPLIYWMQFSIKENVCTVCFRYCVLILSYCYVLLY